MEKRIRQLVKTLLALSWMQWRALISAVFRLIRLAILIRFRSFEWLWQKVGLPSESTENLGDDCVDNVAFAGRLHESVRLASRLVPFRSDCLPRALVLRELLAKYAIEGVVCVGVDKQGVRLHSHAWVEVCGQPIAENSDLRETFVPVDNSKPLE